MQYEGQHQAITVPADYLAELVATMIRAHLSLVDFADSLHNGDERDEAIHVATLARDLKQLAADLDDEGTFPRHTAEVTA